MASTRRNVYRGGYTDSYGNYIPAEAELKAERQRQAQQTAQHSGGSYYDDLADETARYQDQRSRSNAAYYYADQQPGVNPPAAAQQSQQRTGVQRTGASRIGAAAYDEGASGVDGTGNRVVYPSTVGSKEGKVKPNLQEPPSGSDDDGDNDTGGGGGVGSGSGGTGSGSGGTGGTAEPAAAQAAGLGRSDVMVEGPGAFSGPGGYDPYTARGVISNYDPAADAAYQSAMQSLQEAKERMPGYDNSYGDDLAGIYAQITGRQPFSYDLDSDMLYQQYRDQYMRQGQAAMQDTMGQAAALTGGYGSSYAQNVGQQAYNGYLQQLNDRIPELEERAYQRWQGEGDRLAQQYALARDMQQDEYSRYRDAMSDWRQDLAFADEQAQQAYQRGVDQWNREASLDSEAAQREYQQWASGYQANQDAWDRAVQEYQLGQQANETAYQRQQDEQARLLQLMQIGYTPTEEDLRAAGLTTDMAGAWQSYIAAQNAPKGGGGGGGNESSMTPEEWRDYLHEQMALGEIDQEDYNLAMASVFPEYWSKQVQSMNPTLTEEEKRKLQAFAGWSAAGGGM